MMALSSNKIIILLLINILLLLIGCVMETTAAIIILTPIFLPLVMQLGVNPVHFGIIMVVNLFVACSIAKISIEKISKGIVWLLITNIIALFMITYIEPISLMIPRMMGLIK